MPKSGVLGAVRRTPRRLTRPELPDGLEGRVAEICHDLAVQAKRLRQLQEQAQELRVVIREWVSRPRGGLGPRAN
jgi:hypothetical protein